VADSGKPHATTAQPNQEIRQNGSNIKKAWPKE
jgi:hypothetical protein